MTTLLLLVIPPMIVLALIILVAIWLTNFLADRFIGQKHRLLEEIMDTGKMPESWTTSQRVSKKKLVRKLDNLIKYVQTTPLVDDEETREKLLNRLGEARANWLSQ
ncbi:MAG: hypothetical protein AAF629_34715 [Chloroflexota bacterium]